MYKKSKNIGYRFIKRTFDILFSLTTIIAISWLLILIYLIIFITSPANPIYIDKRVGRNGKIIKIYKFRSMIKNLNNFDFNSLPEKEKTAWLNERKIENDPRITKFGRIIRKTSLDELPQLFNILFGSMSLVGPRPITKKELEEHFTEEEIKIITSCRPGLISYWGINGRNNVKYINNERQRLELEYFKKRSLLFDLSMIFKAIPVVLSRKGAQ